MHRVIQAMALMYRHTDMSCAKCWRNIFVLQVFLYLQQNILPETITPLKNVRKKASQNLGRPIMCDCNELRLAYLFKDLEANSIQETVM